MCKCTCFQLKVGISGKGVQCCILHLFYQLFSRRGKIASQENGLRGHHAVSRLRHDSSGTRELCWLERQPRLWQAVYPEGVSGGRSMPPKQQVFFTAMLLPMLRDLPQGRMSG